MRLLLRLAVAAPLLIALSVRAAESRQVEAAEEFFAAIQQVDADQQIKQGVDELLRRHPEDSFYRAEYERFFREVLASPDYKAAKVKAYSETFTEEELRQITQLVQQPGYRVLAAHFVDISNANRLALTVALSSRVQAFSEHVEALRRKATQQAARP